MKKLVVLTSVVFLLFSCKKDKNNNTYKVRYSVTGDMVNQFKITQGTTDDFVVSPFSGTKDTTIYIQSGTMLKLDTKADNHYLLGSIYVNDVLQATGTDNDLDGDGKTEVKIQYGIPQQ